MRPVTLTATLSPLNTPRLPLTTRIHPLANRRAVQMPTSGASLRFLTARLRFFPACLALFSPDGGGGVEVLACSRCKKEEARAGRLRKARVTRVKLIAGCSNQRASSTGSARHEAIAWTTRHPAPGAGQRRLLVDRAHFTKNRRWPATTPHPTQYLPQPARAASPDLPSHLSGTHLSSNTPLAAPTLLPEPPGCWESSSLPASESAIAQSPPLS